VGCALFRACSTAITITTEGEYEHERIRQILEVKDSINKIQTNKKKEVKMKKYIASIITVFAICIFISGCGKGVPKGTDTEVKNTVVEIAKNEILLQLLSQTYLRGLSVAQAEKKAQKDKQVRKVLDEEKAQLASMIIKVVNVRLDSIDNKINKSTNSADLMITNKGQSRKVPITFTAQLNDDGQTYVEVFFK
jgi:hypothetical protein